MNNQPDINAMLNQLKQNPAQILGQRFNIPNNLTSPQQIVQHLLNSGQVSQGMFNKVFQMLPQMQGLIR